MFGNSGCQGFWIITLQPNQITIKLFQLQINMKYVTQNQQFLPKCYQYVLILCVADFGLSVYSCLIFKLCDTV